MSFAEWLRRKWYVFLISTALGAAVASVICQLYFYSLAQHSFILGGVLGWAATYVIYKSEHPGEE
jgi:hypothetical protein